MIPFKPLALSPLMSLLILLKLLMNNALTN